MPAPPAIGCASAALDPLADRCNRSTADLHPQQLIEQRLGLAETQREGTAQQTHQGTEPGAIVDWPPHPAGSVAQVLVEQQGHTSRCSRCSITTGVIGGISIT